MSVSSENVNAAKRNVDRTRKNVSRLLILDVVVKSHLVQNGPELRRLAMMIIEKTGMSTALVSWDCGRIEVGAGCCMVFLCQLLEPKDSSQA